MTTLGISRLFLLFATVWLTGCWMLEKVVLMPESHSKIPFNTVLINKEVLDAVALAIKDVGARDSDEKIPYLDLSGAIKDVGVRDWDEQITYLDVSEGTLETGYFRKSNIAGIRTRVQIERDDKVIVIVVKGAGPYYSELPIEEGRRLLQAALIRRLAEAVAKER
ncbi:hypothetical protein [Methylovulum psychrotolerans]|uniref:Uncharacterized protein n=1 Tax=Methylovulum psychrotolerans TaxID=1704499 RepID=A0A2S5CL74_9GAMM|nr:hypothetical protein [Methylovulum psychrotolerans]POZ51507.1 hypothetical protein AADEFJLK_02373 [Methylovulum psychrotolerans]